MTSRLIVTGLPKSVKLKLSVQYPDGYPDVLPTLALAAVDGEIDEPEKETLLQGTATLVGDSYVQMHHW